MEAPVTEVRIERVFDALRELVFKCFTDEKLLAKWWGPKDFTNPVCELDLHPGGKIRIDMTAPDGTVYPMTGFFRVIDPPQHLLFTTAAFEDENGNSKLEDSNTVTLEEKNGQTFLQLHAEVTKAEPETFEALSGMKEGWIESFDRLEKLLSRIQ